MPVGRERLAKNQAGNVHRFRQPRKDDHQGEAKCFVPEDEVPFHLGLFHGFNFARGKIFVQKKPRFRFSKICGQPLSDVAFDNPRNSNDFEVLN